MIIYNIDISGYVDSASITVSNSLSVAAAGLFLKYYQYYKKSFS